MLNVGKYHLTKGAADYRVPYRNTMLQAVHPTARLGILEVSQDPDDRRKMITLLSREYKGLVLDFATGSRKKGSFIASDSALGQRYWTTPEGAIAYGSNLLTTCAEPPQQQVLTVLVVQDGRYQTGDCHAKIKPDLLPLFGSHGRAIQFRMMSSLYIAKGTAAPGQPDQAADIIMPLSAFKSSRKPPTGAHLWQTTWGNVFFSEKRRTRVSYQVLQWFSFKAIMADCTHHIEAEMARLQLASQSPKAAAALIRPETDAEFTFLDVIRADVHDQLQNHPWVVNGLARMLRQRWLHLATGAGLFATGLMGIPDQTLPDDTIATANLLPHSVAHNPAHEATVIAFRYPVRNWSDVKLFDGRHDPTLPPGTVSLNEKTAASMGGDFDGDYYNFLLAEEFPTMAAELREMHATRTPPEIPKASKRKASHWKNLPRIAYEAMTCPLGWVTNLITKANAAGQLDLADSLAAESQIAVDGLKFDISNDWKLLRQCQDELPELQWLKDLKDSTTFIAHPLRTKPTHNDTIAQLVHYVSQCWQPPQLLARPLEEYAYLMDKPEKAPTLRAHAMKAYRRYGQRVSGLMEMDDDKERQRELKALMEDVHEWADGLQHAEQVALHLWQIAHRHRRDDAPPTTGSLCFHAFAPRICDRLQSPAVAPEVIDIVGLKYHDWASRLSEIALYATLTVQETILKGQIRSMAYLDSQALGIVSSETPTHPGQYPRRLLWNGSGAVYATAP